MRVSIVVVYVWALWHVGPSRFIHSIRKYAMKNSFDLARTKFPPNGIMIWVCDSGMILNSCTKLHFSLGVLHGFCSNSLLLRPSLSTAVSGLYLFVLLMPASSVSSFFRLFFIFSISLLFCFSLSLSPSCFLPSSFSLFPFYSTRFIVDLMEPLLYLTDPKNKMY